ncbi:MAG: alanine racemase [Candidatus Eremiobacteraeota bacterium]|nr:alanine racemase [Candidatus Eremiobacteraeota bacterium]
MRPLIALDETVLRENALAWRRYAGVPVRAVIKANAYGWGVETAVRGLSGVVESFCVSDADEFFELRKYTTAAVIIFNDVPIERLSEIIALGGIPSIDHMDSLSLCVELSARLPTPVRIRLGIAQAFGWNGIGLAALPAFARRLTNSGVEVELWTHVADPNTLDEQLEIARRAKDVLGESGIRIAGTEVASTLPLALQGPMGTSVRLGIGLFGATFGQDVPGIECAICVKAPIIHCARSRRDMRLGYEGGFAPDGGYVILARCGYSDGLPRSLVGSSGILSIGMQYVTIHSGQEKEEGADIMLVDRTTNLDEFAARAGKIPHEVITAFGNARTLKFVEE